VTIRKTNNHDVMETTLIAQLAQMVDLKLEFAHFIWGLIAVVMFFLRSELHKIHKFMEKSDARIDGHENRITKIETKMEDL
jgi:hypothetical protein